MRWDLFCRVVDNYGDVGVCWRLARDLARRGEAVRLWIDDATPLSWMASPEPAGVEVRDWSDASTATPQGDVVVEAFGCELPAPFIAAMAAAAVAPVWVNLEYLSAEGYVERSHGLRSPRFADPGAGLDKWFFYPGFTAATGGLLREADLDSQRAAHDRCAWLTKYGCPARPGERVVSLFCYDGAPLADWLGLLAAEATLLLVPPGAPQRLVRACRGATSSPAGLRFHELPWLAQDEYDRLLWSCDLNFVRGEDSFVRAQWAEVPFVWQIYPQDDGVHADKLTAFLDRFLVGAPQPTADGLRDTFRSWNGLGPRPASLMGFDEWTAVCRSWSATLHAQASLSEQLIAFCRSRHAGYC